MSLRAFLPAVAALAIVGCDSILDVKPMTTVPTDVAIVDANSARAALAGLYDAMQDGSYYGGAYVLFNDLSSDNAQHAGTFTTYADADANDLTADNSTIEGMWDAVYRTIGRANTLIARVPGVTRMDAAERSGIGGEAYAIRALAYFDLLKDWGTTADKDGGPGGVPIRVTPPATVRDIGTVVRADTTAVFAQILADLANAQSRITNTSPSRATVGFVRALRAKVLLYRRNYSQARDEAAAVLGLGYSLAPTFQALFTPDGTRTSEDILRLEFTDQDAMNLGFFYLTRGLGGRREVAPTADLRNSFEGGASDLRRDVTIGLSGTTRYGKKWPTPVGAEDFHVMRLAEVILIKAEAHAQLGELALAVAEYNKVRVRAGLPAHALGVTNIGTAAVPNVLDTQAEVLAAVYRERRSELALEGDRFPDLVRRGVAASVISLQTGRPFAPSQARYPIPQGEIDVMSSIKQNPGY